MVIFHSYVSLPEDINGGFSSTPCLIPGGFRPNYDPSLYQQTFLAFLTHDGEPMIGGMRRLRGPKQRGSINTKGLAKKPPPKPPKHFL